MIWLTVFIDLVGFGIIIPILPLYAERQGATPFQIGALLASYSLMQFIFAPILGSLSDRVGRKPVLALSLLGTAVASVTLGLASSLPNGLWLLFVARTIDGITGANLSTAQAYVADVTTPEKRAKGLGLLGMAFGLGFVLGPAIGGTLASVDIALPFYFVAALALGNSILMLFRLPEPKQHQSFAVHAKSRFSRVADAMRSPATRLLLIITLLGTLAFAMMESTLALLLKDRFGYGEAEAGYVFAFIGVVIAAVQGGLISRLVARFGERPLLVAGSAILAIALALLGAPLPASLAILLVSVSLLAAGSGVQTPALSSLVSRHAPSAAQGTSLGINQSMSALGRIVGPLAGGFCYSVGHPVPYYVGAGLMAVVVAIGILYVTTVAPPTSPTP